MSKIVGVETLKNIGKGLDKINPLRYRVGVSHEFYLDAKRPFPLDLKLRVSVNIRDIRRAIT